MPKPAKGTGQGLIKVQTPVLERARALVEHLSRHGWASIDIDRSDPPTIAGVVSEGLAILEARVKPSRKRS